VKSLTISDEYKVNDKISLVIPTVEEILNDENNHYSIVSSLVATPYDYVVQLAENDIDYESISDFEFFTQIFRRVSMLNTSLIFKDLDLTKFELAISDVNNYFILYDKKNDIVIDQIVYTEIVSALKKIYMLKDVARKHIKKQSKFALLRFFKMQQERAEEERLKKGPYLEGLYISMLAAGCTNEILSYNIYTFNRLAVSKQKFVSYNQVANGYYSGGIDGKKGKKILDSLDWMA